MAPNKALVQTVDILTPVVNDPFTFGRIAAANALSDVYAMGGKPWCAMNICCLPESMMHEHLSDVQAMLAGGLDALNEADCVLCGGHSVQDSELKYGLSVTGVIDPHTIATNTGLRIGMDLIVTKPLGIGILATGVKGHWEGWEESEAMIGRVCGHINAHAGAAIPRFGLTAATDITGFGLIGHALEMAEASHVGIELDVAALPFLPNVLDYAENGLVPKACYTNRAYFQPRTRLSGDPDPIRVLAAFDPETSGGLLLGVPQEKTHDVLASLLDQGEEATVIGTVCEEPSSCVHLVLRG